MWTLHSSSPSPCNNYPNTINNNTNAPTTKTMDEVWKDIGFTSDELRLHHAPSTRGMILQDFFSTDPPCTVIHSTCAPPPPTILTLNSVTDHRFTPLLHLPRMAHLVPGDNGDGGKKRFPPEIERIHGGNRRHKRMIKNRESAARSRARKQAYTNELELEVAQLTEENAMLKKQQQLCAAATASQHGKNKSSFHRTSSAPF